MGQLIAEIGLYAPHIGVDELRLPCHIVHEWHYGPGVTIPGRGSAGIYRCQGHFWGVSLTQDQLERFKIGGSETDRFISALNLTPERQDLGLMSNGGTMSLVAALTHAPQALTVGPLTTETADAEETSAEGAPRGEIIEAAEQAERSPDSDSPEWRGGLTLAELGRPRAGMQDPEAWELYLEEEDWYRRGFATTPEGELCAAFGVTAGVGVRRLGKNIIDSDRVLLNATPEFGIHLNWRGEDDHAVFVRAAVDPPEWVIDLRHTTTIDTESEYEVWPVHRSVAVCPLGVSSSKVAFRIVEELLRLRDNDDETRNAILVALATWGAVIEDAATAVEALLELQSTRALPANVWEIVSRVQFSPRTTREHRDRLKQAHLYVSQSDAQTS